MTQPFDAALGRHLRVPAAPADLRQDLLAAARRQDRQSAVRPLRRVLQGAVAAALVLALAGGGSWLSRRSQAGGGAALAQATLADFMATREGPVPESAAADACAGMACAGDPVLPKGCAGLAVCGGGRGCQVRGQAAACYRLNGGGSLYVFARPIQGAGPRQGRPLALAANYQAKVWNEAGRGYVLVLPR